jgi:hypothetical protein
MSMTLDLPSSHLNIHRESAKDCPKNQPSTALFAHRNIKPPHKLAYVWPLGAGAWWRKSTAGGVSLGKYTFVKSCWVSASLSSCVAVDVDAICSVLREDNVHEALPWLVVLLELLVIIDLSQANASPAGLGFEVFEQRLKGLDFFDFAAHQGFLDPV